MAACSQIQRDILHKNWAWISEAFEDEQISVQISMKDVEEA